MGLHSSADIVISGGGLVGTACAAAIAKLGNFLYNNFKKFRPILYRNLLFKFKTSWTNSPELSVQEILTLFYRDEDPEFFSTDPESDPAQLKKNPDSDPN